MRLGIKLDGAKRSVVTLIVNVRRGRLELLRQYVVNISIDFSGNLCRAAFAILARFHIARCI